MGNVFIETDNQGQPQQTNTHLPLPYPTTRNTPSTSQSATDELIESMNGAKLNNDNNKLTKRRKQNDDMDVGDHPPLTIATLE